MLYAVDREKYVDYIPHEREYRIWVGRLSQGDREAIVEQLLQKIDGDEIHTSSWMPGSDWTNTVFQPIYEVACQKNEEAAAKCFGILLWEVLLKHKEVWSFGRYEKDGTPIQGMTYFRIHRPPPM